MRSDFSTFRDEVTINDFTAFRGNAREEVGSGWVETQTLFDAANEEGKMLPCLFVFDRVRKEPLLVGGINLCASAGVCIFVNNEEPEDGA